MGVKIMHGMYGIHRMRHHSGVGKMNFEKGVHCVLLSCAPIDIPCVPPSAMRATECPTYT